MGYVLLVKVKSDKPVKLWVRVTDQTIPNCVYTDRLHTNRPDGLFQGEALLRYPMPIEPKGVIVEALDANTHTANGIKVDKKLLAAPLNRRFSSFRRDDYDDFLVFAIQISQYGGNWKTGVYKSPRGLWKMYLVDEIRDEKNQFVDTPASMDHDTGIMYWTKSAMRSRTVPNRFVIAMHEFCHKIMDTGNEFTCDAFALDKAYGFGFGKFEIEATLLRLFMDCQCPRPCTGAHDCDPQCPCREKVQRTQAMADQLDTLPDLN